MDFRMGVFLVCLSFECISIVISLHHANINIGRSWRASLTVMTRVGEVVAVVEIVVIVDSCNGDVGKIRRKSISRTMYSYHCKMLYDKYRTRDLATSSHLESLDFSAMEHRNHVDRERSALELAVKMQILRQC